MGFGKGATGTNGNGFQLLVIIFVELFGVTLGQLIAAISPSIQIAVLFNPFLGLVLTTFAGVTIPYPTMAKFWRSWLYQLTPYTRLLSSMLSTELQCVSPSCIFFRFISLIIIGIGIGIKNSGLNIVCQDDEFAVFPPPSGQTCQEWAGEFVTTFGGYLNNPNATDSCQYCQYQKGDEYFTPLNISFDNRWRDAWILFAYFVFNFVVTISESS